MGRFIGFVSRSGSNNRLSYTAARRVSVNVRRHTAAKRKPYYDTPRLTPINEQRKGFMKIHEMFEVREIMEMEDKAKSIKVLDADDCKIMSKALNKNKIILHMKREVDGSEGNVFVYLKEDYQKDFATSKKLFASRKVIGLTLNEFKDFSVEEL